MNAKRSAFVLLLLCLCVAFDRVIYPQISKIEWEIGPETVVSVFYPRWACGDVPPYLVVEVGDMAYAHRVGGSTRLVLDGRELEPDAVSQAYSCRGRFKRSVWMYMREKRSDDPKHAEGRFFHAEECAPLGTAWWDANGDLVHRLMYADDSDEMAESLSVPGS